MFIIRTEKHYKVLRLKPFGGKETIRITTECLKCESQSEAMNYFGKNKPYNNYNHKINDNFIDSLKNDNKDKSLYRLYDNEDKELFIRKQDILGVEEIKSPY